MTGGASPGGESLRALYRQMADRLEKAGCDSPRFDAGMLLEHFTGVGRGELPLRGDALPAPGVRERMEAALAERAAGRPLQYILGEWGFLNLTLAVGEGVLIPRPDTELLCEAAASRLPGSGRLRVLDLCAGSGCVGLGLASLRKGAETDVTAVELSDEALVYLRRNLARYPRLGGRAEQADVLTDYADGVRFPEGKFDALLSNPPYIPARDLSELMPEVKREPRMALDGGDGLKFYRAIAARWIMKLRPGGLCAVEVGLGQSGDVATLLARAGLVRPEVLRDAGGIERVVLGFRAS